MVQDQVAVVIRLLALTALVVDQMLVPLVAQVRQIQ
jgi:hypothetical protein